MSCNRRSFETARAEINTCRVAAFCHAMRDDYYNNIYHISACDMIEKSFINNVEYLTDLKCNIFSYRSLRSSDLL